MVNPLECFTKVILKQLKFIAEKVKFPKHFLWNDIRYLLLGYVP